MFSGCSVRAAVRAAGLCRRGPKSCLLGETLDLEDETDTLVTGGHDGLSLRLASRARLGRGKGSNADAVDDTRVALVLRDKRTRADVPGLESSVRRGRGDKVETRGGVSRDRGDSLLKMLAFG